MDLDAQNLILFPKRQNKKALQILQGFSFKFSFRLRFRAFGIIFFLAFDAADLDEFFAFDAVFLQNYLLNKVFSSPVFLRQFFILIPDVTQKRKLLRFD